MTPTYVVKLDVYYYTNNRHTALQNQIERFLKRKSPELPNLSALRPDLQRQVREQLYFKKFAMLHHFSEDFRKVLCQQVKTAIVLRDEIFFFEN